MTREVGLEKRWKTATVVALDGYQDEGELAVELGFLTRTDQRSGEKMVTCWQGLLAIMDKLGVKKMSELIGKACIICVEMDGKTVVAVEHFFAKNPVSENG